MKCIYQRHSGKTIRIFNSGDWDLVLYTRSCNGDRKMQLWYNPYHERFSGLLCGSMTVSNDREVSIIVAQFGMDMDINSLPKIIPTVHISWYDSVIDIAGKYALAQ